MVGESIIKDVPLVSVIIPVYNVEKYLDQCVESVVNQVYENLEIILVDDGSTDHCPKICDLWKMKDSRVKVLHKKNGGLSDARNAGVSIASGELIVFIDSDDWVEKQFINEMYLAMKEFRVDIVECAVQYVDEDGEIIRIRKLSGENTILTKIKALKSLILEDGVYQTVWNKLYKKDLLKGIEFEVGKCHEDDFWTYKVIDHSVSMAVLNIPLYKYRQRRESIMGNGYNIKRLDGVEARFERLQYLKKYVELDILCRQKFMMDCMWNLQSVFIYLKGKEKEYAYNYIVNCLKSLKKISILEMTLNRKNKIWLFLFQIFPIVTVKIRNRMKIGL